MFVFVTALVPCLWLLQHQFSVCVCYSISSVFVVVTASVQCLWLLQHQFSVCGCYSISSVFITVLVLFVTTLVLCLLQH